MLQNKKKRSLFPNYFLFQLTFINVIIIIIFVSFSSWSIYKTACRLTDNMLAMSPQNQQQFDSMLFHYLCLFSILAVVVGSLVHFYLTRKMTQPLRDLIDFTKKMKQGDYPKPIRKQTRGDIGELTNHINELVEQLTNNERDRKKLVTDLSHEFRTPLTNLTGYLRALQNGVIEGDPKLYQSLYAEATKLTKLVEQMEQLKEWDQIDAPFFIEKAALDIQRFINESVTIFDWTLAQKQIELNVDLEGATVRLSRTQISQVISNLLDNAIRYYEGTGPITIKGEKRPTDYKLSVIGPGRKIPEIANERLFERFYRTEPSRARTFGGSGLGLAISKEIIEHHRGDIGFDSDGNKHTFWFVLPYK